MQTATANNINFTNSAARNAPDEQQEQQKSTKRACGRRGRDEERGRRRQNDDNEGVWHQRRIEMLTQLHLLMNVCVYVCIDKYSST